MSWYFKLTRRDSDCRGQTLTLCCSPLHSTPTPFLSLETTCMGRLFGNLWNSNDPVSRSSRKWAQAHWGCPVVPVSSLIEGMRLRREGAELRQQVLILAEYNLLLVTHACKTQITSQNCDRKLVRSKWPSTACWILVRLSPPSSSSLWPSHHEHPVDSDHQCSSLHLIKWFSLK